MKLNTKWSLLFVAATSVLLFTESRSQNNFLKKQAKRVDKNALKRPESWKNG